jgi:hypothetical protein
MTTVGGDTSLTLAGGKIYFHDGAKVLSCDRAAGCGGGPTTVVTEASGTGITALTVAGDAVYYATSDGKIRSAPAQGGNGTDMTTGQENTYDIVADGADLYWVNYTRGGSYDDGSMVTCKIAQCAATTVALNGQARANDVAVDSGYVYWAGVGNGQAGNPQGYVRRCARGATCATPENLQQPYRSVGLVVSGTNFYYMAGAPPAPNNSSLPFTCPVAGCATSPGTPLSGAAGNTAHDTNLALDATSVYWLDAQLFASSISVFRCPLAGCGSAAPETFATYGGDFASAGIAVDEQYVFIAAEKGSGYDIVRYAK